MEPIPWLLQSIVIGGADDPTSIVVTGQFAGVWILFSLFSLIGLAERVLLAFAAYYDASARGNRDAVMWAFLIGFFGWIPGVIYLCIRNSGHTMASCPNCGCVHPLGDLSCPRCGAPASVRNENPFFAQQERRAKGFLITALVLIGIAVVVGVLLVLAFTTTILSAQVNVGYRILVHKVLF